MTTEKSPLRLAIERALEDAGLGRKFDREIPVLAAKIYREEVRKEVEYQTGGSA